MTEGGSSGGQPRAWRWVGWSFLAGGVVDLAFGATILFAAEAAAPVLRVTLPEPRIYLDLDGLLLTGLGAIYLLIWREPRRLAPVAAAATLLRFAGCALFVTAVITGRAEPTFRLIALLDGGLAVVHLLLLRRAAGSLFGALRALPAASPARTAE